MELTEEARRLDLADRYLNAHSSKYIFKIDDTERAENTMRMFSREDENGNINVHEMQTMWYEIHCGKAHYRKGELRQSLKQFSYLEKHCETMMEDCFDFHYYSFRKTTINHYIQMLKFEDSTFKGKWPTRGCIGTLKCLAKIKKMVAANPDLIEETKKEYEEYKQSDKYKKWEKEYDKRDNDDPVANDPDPEGYELYIKAMEKPDEIIHEYATKVAQGNPANADLQVKCLCLFLEAKKDDLAVQCAVALIDHNATHPKTERAIETIKAKLPASVDADAKAKITGFKATKSETMEHAHELLKASPDKGADACVKALSSDPSSKSKVFVAENTHRRLKDKAKNEGVAKKYFEAAAKLYPYSTYFEGAKKESK